MAVGALSGAVELIRALAKDRDVSDPLLRRQSRENGKDLTIMEDGIEQDVRRCRPADKGDYLRRLRTFSVPWWFNMPNNVSPIECARRGWVNVSHGVIQCECCGEQVVADKLRKDTDRARKLVEGHNPFCPWRSHEVTLTDPSKLSDREVAEDVRQRLLSLKASLRHYPLLVDNSCAAKTLKAMALAGWEVDAQMGSSSGVEYLRCAFCLRTVAVQSFDHRPVPPDSGNSENASAQDAEGDGTPEERASKVARLSPPLPPQQGLWTPQPRAAPLGGAPEADVGNAFDQYALHRFFCPMYSRAGDELPAFALRCARVHEGAVSDARGVCSDKNGVEVEDDTEKSIARAEELLRDVHELLPLAD